MVFSFASMIAVIFGLYLLINNLFLERYYIRQKMQALTDIYEEINAIDSLADYNSSAFETSFRKISGANNVDLSILWVSAGTEGAWVVYQTRDNAVMRARIEGYLFGLNAVADARDVLLRTENYQIQKFQDSVDEADYLEAWGKLQTGCFFLMRIPIESIRENVKISNRFTFYIILAAVAAAIFFVWWISRRISVPLQELTGISRRMANLEFGARYRGGGDWEIAELGANFNHMADTLERTISELKTANNELKQDIEKKTQVDEMRKEFLSNVSHELKTPLALIQGYAEGLKEAVNEGDADRDFYCDVIMDETEKMNAMVKKLLTLNQLEFGNEVVDMERFDLTELLNDAAQHARVLAEAKRATVLFDRSDPLYVWGDAFLVGEVVTNYVSNAANHVSENGRITLSAEQTAEKVRVSVRNTGDPIPEEELEKVWVKFYKVDKARTRAYGGSGIGLSIVQAIMERLHQGYGVCNTDDGVCFWFELDSGDIAGYLHGDGADAGSAEGIAGSVPA